MKEVILCIIIILVTVIVGVGVCGGLAFAILTLMGM